jgi:hypothetical protein
MLALGSLDAKPALAVDVTAVQGEVVPTDPGAVSKLTVKFENWDDLAAGTATIVIDPEDDMKVPSVIDPSDVTITTNRFTNFGTTGSVTGTLVANPLGVNVRFLGTPKDNPEITLDIGDMEPSTLTEGLQGIKGALLDGSTSTTVTVVFRQGAGIQNASEAEAGFAADGTILGRDVRVSSSADTTKVNATASNRIFIPRLVEITDGSDKRGKVISVVGRGFANGTTATIWRDVDGDGTRDAGEVDLGQAEVDSDDTFTFSLTISAPPFTTTSSDNKINAIDGKQNTLNGTSTTLPISGVALASSIPTFTLESSFTVTPTTASIGDTVQVTVKDFTGSVSITNLADISLGGVAVTNPTSKTTNANGESTFNITIPNGVPDGSQSLKIVEKTGEDLTTGTPRVTMTISGANLSLTPQTNLVPNQTVTVIGSGYTLGGSATIAGTSTDTSSILIDGDGTGLKASEGEATNKINEGSSISIDNGGNWSSSVILPINDTTVVTGTHELKITDDGGREGTVSLIMAPRELELDPSESRVGTTVAVTGSGFPADNTKTGAASTPSVAIKYTVSGTAQTVATLTPDASGNISGSFTVPLTAGIPSTNSVTAEFSYTPTGGSSTTSTTGVTHAIPRATVAIDPKEGPSGTVVTITGAGFKTFSTLSALELGGIDVRPAPVPSTDNQGGFTTSVIVPQANTGSQSITATVASTVATDTFTVLAAGITPTPGPVPTVQAPSDAFAAVIANDDNLQRLWHFDPASQDVAPDFGWFLYDTRAIFASANTYSEVTVGDFVWALVRDTQSGAAVCGVDRSLFAGWNPVTC